MTLRRFMTIAIAVMLIGTHVAMALSTYDIEWAENAGGSASEQYNSVTAVADGYVAVGYSYSNDAPWGNNGDNDAIIVKYDLNGNVVWAENAGGNYDDHYYSVTAVADGYVAVGYSWSTDAIWGNNGGGDAIIVKYDLSGNVVWAENAGGSASEYYESVTAEAGGELGGGSVSCYE
jgi:hypothetical protein